MVARPLHPNDAGVDDALSRRGCLLADFKRDDGILVNVAAAAIFAAVAAYGNPGGGFLERFAERIHAHHGDGDVDHKVGATAFFHAVGGTIHDVGG